MELVRGQLVRSRKGRDVTRLYAANGQQGERWLLVNGDKWTLLAPKKKNARHIQPINHVLEETDMQTDLKIKTALRAYEARQGREMQGG